MANQPAGAVYMSMGTAVRFAEAEIKNMAANLVALERPVLWKLPQAELPGRHLATLHGASLIQIALQSCNMTIPASFALMAIPASKHRHLTQGVCLSALQKLTGKGATAILTQGTAGFDDGLTAMHKLTEGQLNFIRTCLHKFLLAEAI